MNAVWRYLLSIDQIPEEVSWRVLEFGWERPIPGWAWGLIVFGAGLFAVWSYSALSGSRLRRGFAAGFRFVLLLVLVIILSGPMLVYPREQTERDWVFMLMDRSRSMTVADVDLASGSRGGLGNRGGRVSRDAQLSQSLRDGKSGIGAIEKAHDTAWLGFDSEVFDLGVRAVKGADGGGDVNENNKSKGELVELKMPILGGATGSRTAIGPVLAQTLRRAAARPVSGIVLFSDGRTTVAPDREVLRRLRAEAIPVFVVPMGSALSLGDLMIREVDAPRRAFVHDKTPVVVKLDHLGSVLERTGAEVVLTDAATGEVFDRKRIERGGSDDAITLTATPKEAGRANWVVRVDTDIPDLVEENNTKTIQIDLLDRPIRVLYVEGYARWEYQYLKNMLVREGTIDSSVFLLSADREFAQEGNTPLTRLPNSPEEFEPFDVIILGDVGAGYFSERQLEMIHDHVAERGAGLLWLAGERANPKSYAGTALAGLLPVQSSAVAGFGAIGVPVTLEPTANAKARGILNLVDQDGSSAWVELLDPENGWNQLWWAFRIDPADLKPTTEVLADTVESFGGGRSLNNEETGGGGLPLVLLMRFGAGESVFVATDEIWRWRYGRGERLPEQFWIQMIRMLGRDRLITSGRRATLTAGPRRVEIGQPSVIELRLFDEKMVEKEWAEVPAEIVDDRGSVIANISLRPQAGAPGRYSATYIPSQTGTLTVRITDSAFRAEALSADVDVYRAEDEMQNPEADHGFLAQLAEQTGGAVLQPMDWAEKLPGMLPRRAVRTQMDVTESIWDTPFFLIVFMLLLVVEWVSRKMLRLV